MPIDWREFRANDIDSPAVIDPRRRMIVCFWGFLAGLAIVFGRTIQLEIAHGAAFRAAALRPMEKRILLPAPRGRILARDGTVLACDRTVKAAAVQYRWLENPPNERWLRNLVRARLDKRDRRNAQKIAAERAAVLAERTALAERLARLCGLSPQQWSARVERIQAQVERIAAGANRRRHAEAAEPDDAETSWTAWIRRLLLEEPPTPPVIVAEELEHHVVADDIPPAVAAEIEGHANRYPGVKIRELARRVYPGGALAAHVVGHLGLVRRDELSESRDEPPTYLPDDMAGRAGIERQCEAELRGRRGVAVDRTDHAGHVAATYRPREPIAGSDVTLTIDAALQRTAEELLQGALERRTLVDRDSEPAGGAIAVMDVRNGDVLAAASAPAFDPNLFARSDSQRLTTLLADRSRPLFDRVSQMAIPPGSAFKVLTAVALLESGAVRPQESFYCQGYLDRPDRQRCQIYVRQGIGHGDVTLADALCVSCNVYFFHFAGRMGPRPLLDWAARFGFGRPTGIDLPGESAGLLPSPENIGKLEGRAWRTADTQAMAIGQGALLATPLQVLRMTAAVANGGRLLTPHVERLDQDHYWESGRDAPLRIKPETLRAIREGLLRVVSDPRGTAHGTVYVESTAVAGKTGTAETGDDRANHAWFAGYAPADNPRMAFVVALERAGDGATAAGPLTKRLVRRLEQLGLL